MSLFNLLLGKKLGGGGGSQPTGTITLTQNNHTYDVRDYAEAVTQILEINKVSAMIENNTGYALSSVKCLEGNGKPSSDSTTISNGRSRSVFYPVRQNAFMSVTFAPVASFIISETAQGQVPTLLASNNKYGAKAYVVQREYEQDGNYFVVGTVVADIITAEGTIITLTASS